MVKFNELPEPIAQAVVKMQRNIDWVNMVPAFAEFPITGGRTRWCKHEDITVAIAEQLVEFNTRKALAAIKRWQRTGSETTCKTAAHRILLARTYRCTYFTLMGQKETHESDMPFACID